jgi:hypothetical protein
MSLGRSKENQAGLKLNGTHQLLVYVDDINLLGGNIGTIKERLADVAEKTKYILLF